MSNMTIYIGADHRGYKLKEELKKYLMEKGYDVRDAGNTFFDPGDDYPDYAIIVGEKISANPSDLGILICGSGVGMAVAAGKFKNVRAGTVTYPDQAKMVREHEDLNVLTLPSDFIGPETAKQVVDVFLTTEFSTEERHRRRTKKISDLENKA